MSFYICEISSLPVGVEYRVLGVHPVWGNIPLVETRTPIAELPEVDPDQWGARPPEDYDMAWETVATPVVNPSVASRAVVLLNALAPKLPTEYADELQRLTDGVIAATGTNATLGEAATHEAQQLISDLHGLGLDALADQIAGALAAVQGVWMDGVANG